MFQDVAGLVVWPSVLSMVVGDEQSISLKLRSQPVTPVTLSLTFDTDKVALSGTGSSASVTFNSSDWDVPQEISLRLLQAAPKGQRKLSSNFNHAMVRDITLSCMHDTFLFTCSLATWLTSIMNAIGYLGITKESRTTTSRRKTTIDGGCWHRRRCHFG